VGNSFSQGGGGKATSFFEERNPLFGTRGPDSPPGKGPLIVYGAGGAIEREGGGRMRWLVLGYVEVQSRQKGRKGRFWNGGGGKKFIHRKKVKKKKKEKKKSTFKKESDAGDQDGEGGGDIRSLDKKKGFPLKKRGREATAERGGAQSQEVGEEREKGDFFRGRKSSNTSRGCLRGKELYHLEKGGEEKGSLKKLRKREDESFLFEGN